VWKLLNRNAERLKFIRQVVRYYPKLDHRQTGIRWRWVFFAWGKFGKHLEPVISDRQILAVGFVEFWSEDDMLGGGVARYSGGN